MKTAMIFCVVALTFASCKAIAVQDSPAQKENAAASSPQPGISAAEVLDKYIAATGGLEARRALKNMESSGRFGLGGFDNRGRSGGLGDFHFYYKSPNNDAFELEHAQRGAYGHTWFGHSEGTAFIRQTAASNWAINGVTIESLDNAWLAVGEWDFNRLYSAIKLVGRSDVNGKPAYALLFTPREGDPQIRYFDEQTFLLVRMDQVSRLRPKQDGPETRIKVETYYSDYKDTAGIKFPRVIRAIGAPSHAKEEMEFVASDMKINHEINDAIFKKE